MTITSPLSRTSKATVTDYSLDQKRVAAELKGGHSSTISKIPMKASSGILVVFISVILHAVELSAQQRISPAEAAKYSGNTLLFVETSPALLTLPVRGDDRLF